MLFMHRLTLTMQTLATQWKLQSISCKFQIECVPSCAHLYRWSWQNANQVCKHQMQWIDSRPDMRRNTVVTCNHNCDCNIETNDNNHHQRQQLPEGKRPVAWSRCLQSKQFHPLHLCRMTDWVSVTWAPWSMSHDEESYTQIPKTMVSRKHYKQIAHTQTFIHMTWQCSTRIANVDPKQANT